MANPTLHLLTNATLGFKKESAEGSYNAPVSADFNHFVRDFSVGPDITRILREGLTGDRSKLASVLGSKLCEFSVTSEFKGAGNATVTTVPEVAKFLLACGYQQETLKSVTVDNFSGTFVDGEAVTGATTGAGVVFKATSSGTALLMVTTSDFTTDNQVITGATSSATCDQDGTTTDDYGLLYRPSSTVSYASTGADASYSASIQYVYDQSGTAATEIQLVGVRGDLEFLGEVNNFGRMVFRFRGIINTVQDQSSAIVAPTRDPSIPRAVHATGFGADGKTTEITARSFRMALQNELVPREDFRATQGVLSTRIGTFDPIVEIDPELTKTSDWNAYSSLTSRTEASVGLLLDGGSAGERAEFHAPFGVIDNWQPDARGPFVAQRLQFGLIKTAASGQAQASDRAAMFVFR